MDSIALISVGVPWFDTAVADAKLASTRRALASEFEVLGPERVVTDELELARLLVELRRQAPLAAVLQLGTFPDGNTPARVAETLEVPVVLSGFPEVDLGERVLNNSLCGLNMATYTLSELDKPHSYVFGDPDDAVTAARLVAHARAAVTLRGLRGSTVGLLGYRAPGFYPATFDELLLRRQFGVRVEHVGIQEVTDRVRDGVRRAPPVDAFPVIEGGDLSAEAIDWLSRYYGALHGAVQAAGLSTVAVKDWPEMAPFDPDIPAGIWPAVSWLQDDGVNVAPEGDVNGAVTMELLHRLTGNVPFFTDISAVDAEASTLTLWHYGGAPSLTRSLGEVRFGADGRELEFTLRAGPAVLARLGYSRGEYRLLIVEVEVLDERLTLRRAAAAVRTLRTPADAVVERLLSDGWEHHVSLVHGAAGEALRAFGKMAGLEVTEL